MTDTAAKSPATAAKSIAQVQVRTKAIAVKRTSKGKAALLASAKAVKVAQPAKSAKAPTVRQAAPASKPLVATKKKALVKPAKPVALPQLAKAKKPKMVRDSMTMPKAEYAVLDALKLRAAKLASPVKKTELLRAGIKALAAMSDTSFVVALKAVPSLKIGRPSKS